MKRLLSPNVLKGVCRLLRDGMKASDKSFVSRYEMLQSRNRTLFGHLTKSICAPKSNVFGPVTKSL